MKSFIYALLFLSLLSCSKKEEVSPRQCYKDFYFNSIKGFYCLTAQEAENYAILKRQGKTSMNLAKATEADYTAAPDKVSGCNTCR